MSEEDDFKERVWKENPEAIKIRFNRVGGAITGFDILSSVKVPEKMLVEPNYVPRDVAREVPSETTGRPTPPDASEVADSGVQPPELPPVMDENEYGAENHVSG